MLGVCLFCNVSLCVLMRNYRHNNRQFLRCVPLYGLVCIVSGIVSGILYLFGCRSSYLYIYRGVRGVREVKIEIEYKIKNIKSNV